MLSAGISAAKRSTYNPLVSDKTATFGSYASLSLDYDLLAAIKSVTNMIFK